MCALLGRAALCALLGRAALCARGRRPARSPSAPRASLGASSRSPARPRHRPRAPQPGPTFCSPPVPSGPSGALHTGGAGSLMCALRVVSKPGQAPLPPIDFARNSPAACSNIEFASLELQCFWGVSKNEHDKLRAKFGRRWCRCCPWIPQFGLAAPCGYHGGLAC